VKNGTAKEVGTEMGIKDKLRDRLKLKMGVPIGARIVKTGIAVMLSVYICRLLQIEPASFAAITAVVNMQPSVNKALKNAWEQVLVNVVAVVLAIVLGLLVGRQAWVIGLGVMAMIVIANRLGWGGLNVGIVSIIFILDAPHEDFVYHAGVRSLAIFIGLTVALVINRVIAPPKHKERFLRHLEEFFQDASTYFIESLRTFANSSGLEEYHLADLSALEKKMQAVQRGHQYAREEIGPKDNPELIARMLELCRGLVERGRIIENMTLERIKRRRSPEAPSRSQSPSLEFKRILELLNRGADRIEAQRDLVLKGLKESHPPGPKGNDKEFWAEFDEALSAWQRRVSGEYYLRAMMEVVVVASEMRWAFRRMRTVYNLSSTEQQEPEKIVL